MSSPCQSLGRFFDGELTAAEAEQFRGHLVTCEKCQAGLGELLQLGVLGERYGKLKEQPVQPLAPVVPLVPPPAWTPRVRPAWRRPVGAGVGLALAASLALVVASFWQSVPDSVFRPGGAEGRLTEARSSYPRSASYQKLASRSLGPGQGKPMLAYGELAKLKDPLALASALLVHGDASHVEDALMRLGSTESPDYDSERAMAHLVRGDAERADFEEALRCAERALAKDPGHGPALWNKALALEKLGLTMLAASTFDHVAQLQEPGWAAEAKVRAEALRQRAESMRDAYRAAKAAATELADSGSSLPEAAMRAPIGRKLFGVAVRMRTSAQEVKALLPLAARLDARNGDSSLHDYVQWVAGRDFAVRRPLVTMYRTLRTASGAEAASLVRQLWSSDEDDLAVVAMVLSRVAPGEGDLSRLLQRARGLKDPDFVAMALLRSSQVLQASDLRLAKKHIEEAIQIASAARLEHRLLELKNELVTVLLLESDLAGARAQASEDWALAVRLGDWEMQLPVIENLAQVARLRDDYPVARAYLEEVVERTREDHLKAQEQYVRLQLADLELCNLRPGRAREQLDAAIATGLPLDSLGIGVLADVARSHPAALDRQAIDAFRAGLSTKAGGERALALHDIGRWTIEVNPEEGRRLLRDAIAQAGPAADMEGDAARARAFSFTALIMDSARRGDFTSVLDLVGEEAGAPFPATCAVALSVDLERSAVVARGPSGHLEGEYSGARTEPVGASLDGLVSPRLLSVLEGCREVKVVARPPLFGKLGALPNTMPWSYLLLGRSGSRPLPPPPGGRGTHLVVQGVALSKRFQHLGLLVPQPWVSRASPPAGFSVLEGQDASPSRILASMQSATDIDIVTHSIVDPISHEALLVTAEAPEGDRLTATQLRNNPLPGRPIVMLSACGAAHPAPVLHEPRSLPAALLLAGARVVLAAHADVPEREGPDFFEEVRKKIWQGDSPAAALHETRQAWRSQGKVRNWVESVLLFE